MNADTFIRITLEHNSFEDAPWITRLVEFTQKVLAQDRVRVLGICFGHQIVGRALGAKVGRSEDGWEIAVCDMDLTDKGKEIFGLEKLVRCPAGHNAGKETVSKASELTSFRWYSASSRCTGILCSPARQMSPCLVLRHAAQFRECTHRDVSSLFKATLSLIRRSRQRLFSLVPRLVFLVRTKAKTL